MAATQAVEQDVFFEPGSQDVQRASRIHETKINQDTWMLALFASICPGSILQRLNSIHRCSSLADMFGFLWYDMCSRKRCYTSCFWSAWWWSVTPYCKPDLTIQSPSPGSNWLSTVCRPNYSVSSGHSYFYLRQGKVHPGQSEKNPKRTGIHLGKIPMCGGTVYKEAFDWFLGGFASLPACLPACLLGWLVVCLFVCLLAAPTQ